VRSLLRRRGKDERRALLAEIDRLVASLSALSAKQADLEEQTSAREFGAAARNGARGQAKLAATESAYDRQLLSRQLAVIETRRQAIDKALVMLDRMRVRRSLAEHQLKQLRLDLSRQKRDAWNHRSCLRASWISATRSTPSTKPTSSSLAIEPPQRFSFGPGRRLYCVRVMSGAAQPRRFLGLACTCDWSWQR